MRAVLNKRVICNMQGASLHPPRRHGADKKTDTMSALLTLFPFTAYAAQDRKRLTAGAIFGGKGGLE